MSKEEVRKVIMIIVSGYLAYIGYKLLRDYDPSKNKIYLVAAIVFIAFGIVSAVHYVRNVIALRRGDFDSKPCQKWQGFLFWT